MVNRQTNQAIPFTYDSDEPVIDLPHQIEPQVRIPQEEYYELKWRVGMLKSLHERAVLREQKLKEEIKKKDAEIRDLKKRLFGKSSEKKSGKKREQSPSESSSKKPRGQQSGSRGHGRTKRPNLPEKDEERNFSELPICDECGKPYVPDGTYQEEEIIEVEVSAHKRRIKKQRVEKGCTCKKSPQTLIAPSPPKVIPKSPYGNSVWESILINKFLHCQPTHRFLTDLSHLGLPISQGSVTGGLQRLSPLFEPVYDALQQQQVMEECLFHNDETRWKVFEHVEGKAGNLWWLWVSRSDSVIFFQIAQSRGASVPLEYFEPAKERQVKLIVICDRYSAYKSLAKQLHFIILAFCWAHVRRDFLTAAQKHPEIKEWGLDWVKKISDLYHVNNQRCREFDPQLPLQWQSPAFKEHHAILIEKLDEMAKDRDGFLEKNDPDDSDLDLLTKVKAKVLLSLKNHWKGLIVFVDHPKVPMDNNKGEQAIRNPVTGRKAFYGSGSEWSSMLAAMMFSIFQTLGLWGLNPRHWLRDFLTACAQNNGQVPDDLSPFIPWQMDDARRDLLSKPPPPSSPDTS